MAATRRTPLIFTVLAILFVVVPVAGIAWWMNQPKVLPDLPPPLDDFDVVCSGRVDVPGMLIALEPSQPGRVVELSSEVSEGKPVKAQQVILKLDDSAAKSRRMAAQSAVDLADVQLRQAELDEKRFPEQLAAKKTLLEATAARVVSAKKILDQKKLQAGVTPIGKAEMEAMESQIKELELLESAEKAQWDDWGKLQPGLAVEAAKARKNAAVAEWQLADQALNECVLRAPSDGILLRLQATVGGTLIPGGFNPAVVFAPTAKGLIVRAEIDQEYLGRVKEGQAAEIQDDHRIDTKVYKGKVLQLAKFVAQKRSILLDPGEINDVRTVECLIAFDSPTDDLIIGQRLRVRIRGK